MNLRQRAGQVDPGRGLDVESRRALRGHATRIHPVGLDLEDPYDRREYLSALGGIKIAVDEAIAVLRGAGVEPLDECGF
jgi:hypothetical protein